MLNLTPTTDPHCGRSSDADLNFALADDTWTTTWGRHDAFGSPAYWIVQAARGHYDQSVDQMHDSGLMAEVAFCILGGYGVSAEAAASAHRAVAPLVAAGCSEADEYERYLLAPCPESGRRYRFPRQRASRLAGAVRAHTEHTPPVEPLELRDWLLALSGIGPKTASWIVRNYTGSDDVAIIDIWLIRALTACGVFQSNWDVRRDYFRYESAFLQYAALGEVRASALDLCIWSQARTAGPSHLLSA
jgi:thermostable 8-oxoguanine DNA glycosylase